MSSASKIDALMFTLNDVPQQAKTNLGALPQTPHSPPWARAGWQKTANRPAPKLILLLAQKDRYACNPHPFGARPSGSAPHAASGCTLDAP